MKVCVKYLFPAILSGCLLYACNTTPAEHKLFELMANTGIDFQNKVVDGKIENSFLFRNFYNGGGVAIGDVNNDGLADVFFTSNAGENKLYINKGSFKFDDITSRAGFKQDSMWSTGVVLADINSDGWLDIYVCNSGHMSTGNRRNKLYINNHDLTFTESAAKYGLDISAYTTQVSFFDYDNDGDLDCFMINNSPIPVNQLGYTSRRDLPENEWPVGAFLKGGGDHLFKNDNGFFKEVTKEAGIHGSLISFGLGAVVADVNGDGYPDIYVSNDSYERDYLYLNQKNGTFKDQLEQCIQHTSMSSMGADIADINNDGYPDIFTTDMLPDDDYRLKTTGSFDNIDLFNGKLQAGFYYQYVKNCLQLNDKDGKFCEIANYSGVSATDWSWGALMFDADNDGYNDIYVCNGVNKDVTNLDFMDFFANDVIQKMVLTHHKESVDSVLARIPQNPILNKAFRNSGNLQFTDAGKSWGFTQPSFSNGAAYGDLDNDGDLDLVINNENAPAFIYKNNAREINRNSYIGFSLKGGSKNGFAIGTNIKVYAGNQILSREVMPSRGFQSSVDYKQIIGLGTIRKIDSMVIVWPDHSVNRYLNPAVDSLYTIQQGETDNSSTPVMRLVNTSLLFQPVNSVFDKHAEDDYLDFYSERNIPEMLSREGPKACVGDVNGDGLQDIYIAGAKGHIGQLYIQTAAATFKKTIQPAFNQFADFEDGAVLFFDADADGDLDLFIGPAGNENPPYSREMQNRLFVNDGRGRFTLNASAFINTKNGINTTVAAAYDFNHDGYTDLFVGGRSTPQEYGINPSSNLFMNDGKGEFKDITSSKIPGIANIGMITGASWCNITGDSAKELVVTGEWMAPHIFSFNKDHFEEVKTNITNLLGLWQTVLPADINGDGKVDLILGNIGENFYLRPDSTKPVKLWIADFDQNGTIDKILTSTINGKDMPVFLKHEMQDQIPSLKKQNLRHEEFAKKSIQELFTPEVLKKCIVKQFNYPASCIALNKGDGIFTIQQLPSMMQLSSVNAVVCTDIDRDGKLDLIAGGNQYGFQPQFGRLDGSFGDVLLNKGKDGFEWMGPDKSGLYVQGQVRDLVEIKNKNKSYILFLRNDDYPVFYQLPDFLKTNLQH